jgi:hypothetical protein
VRRTPQKGASGRGMTGSRAPKEEGCLRSKALAIIARHSSSSRHHGSHCPRPRSARGRNEAAGHALGLSAGSSSDDPGRNRRKSLKAPRCPVCISSRVVLVTPSQPSFCLECGSAWSQTGEEQTAIRPHRLSPDHPSLQGRRRRGTSGWGKEETRHGKISETRLISAPASDHRNRGIWDFQVWRPLTSH